LDGDGAADRVEGTEEDGHQPVPQVLYVLAPLGRHRFPEEREVSAPHLFGEVVTYSLEQLG